jgi:lantibiotic modifying enzyme
MTNPQMDIDDAGAFLEVADGLGARLAREAIWHGPRCNWTGDVMDFLDGRWQVVHRALPGDVYGGTAGVALFLGRLHAATRERLYARVAQAALEQAAAQLPALPAAAGGAFYAGALGIAWAMLRVGHLVDAPALAERGWQAVEAIARADAGATGGLDITSGSAGAIAGLLDLLPLAAGDPALQGRLLEAAARHGRRLVDTARRDDRGWHWAPEAAPATEHGLCGLSHGAAGMAWALLALHRATGEPDFAHAGREAMRYERSWFSRDEQNWPDLRSLYDPMLGAQADAAAAQGGRRLVYMSAWCHGAPGIGLARLATHALTGDAACLDEARAALRTTRVGLELSLQQPAWSQNFSLCHGLAGNAELLLDAGRALGDAASLALARRVGASGRALYAQPEAPWPCGVNGGGETPALLLGLAGIGHFYLRLHDAATPSVLLLPGAAAAASPGSRA